MEHFKNRPGFTLVEAMIAVAMVALVAIPALNLILASQRRAIIAMHEFRRLLFAKNFLLEMQRNRYVQQEDKKDDTSVTQYKNSPPTNLTYQIKPVDAKSPLHQISGLFIEQVSYAWKDGNKNKQGSVVTLLYKRPVKPEKKS